MQIPLEVNFRNMDHSAELEAEIRHKAENLEEFCDRITSCRVMVEAPHQHHRKGNLYRVRIHLSVPQKELVVDHDPGNRYAHEDVDVTIRDAFNAARRQLQDYVREIQGKTKTHEVPPHGRVSELYSEDNYGFITTPDDREIFFHANSVSNDAFDQLKIGSEVRFTEEEGEKGPQATTVHIEGRHHHLAE